MAHQPRNKFHVVPGKRSATRDPTTDVNWCATPGPQLTPQHDPVVDGVGLRTPAHISRIPFRLVHGKPERFCDLDDRLRHLDVGLRWRRVAGG
jgi:hypothetical protein